MAKIARGDEVPSQPVLSRKAMPKDRSAFGAGILSEVEPAPGHALWSRRFVGGDPLWSRSFGGKSHDYADHVAVDAAGDVFITDSFMEKIDFGGKTHRCRGVHDVFVARIKH